MGDGCQTIVKKSICLIALVLGCSEPAQEEAMVVPIDSTPVAPDTISQNVIATRSVIFVEASGADLDSLRAKYSEEDYAVVADDAMWYRATAYEYLEKLKLPVTRVIGRRPFVFQVNGQPRTYDLRDSDWLDVIIVYEPGREPRLIAPVDIQAAAEYFGIPISTSE